MNGNIFERYAQPVEVHAIINRTAYSIACQTQIAAEWVWQEKSVAVWQAELDAVQEMGTGLQAILTARDAEMNGAESHLGAQLQQLHDDTVAGLGVARIRWRQHPERGIAFRQLSGLGRTPEQTLAEAEMWELAWEEFEPGFVPMDGLTLAVFASRRTAAMAAMRAVRRARLRRALDAGNLAVAMVNLEDTAQAWYAEATSIFPEGSGVAAEVIRSVPTSYVPRYAEASKRRRAAARQAAEPAG